MLEVWVWMCILSLASSDQPRILFHSPESNQSVSGRSFVIDIEISGLLVPQEANGILLMDEKRLLDVRQQHTTITMDGVGGLSEGHHTLRLLLLREDGSRVLSESVTFIKAGSPHALEGPFHDSRFDDDALQEMQVVCSQLAIKAASKIRSRQDFPIGHRVIALGLPVVSSRTKYDGEENDDMRISQSREEFIHSINDLPMIKIFIPSLIDHAKQEQGDYTYKVYLGYDKGDPFFDVESKREALSVRLEEMTKGAPVQFLWFRYEGMEGKVFWIYNDLFRQAYEDGADYFYMVNDDLLILTSGWVDRFVTALETNIILPDFGVAGPLDIRDRHKHHMCFTFHGRLHYEIFGDFYPVAFQNWWSDYWVSLVYGPNATFWFPDIEVRNTEVEGRRYPAFWEGSELFVDEVRAGRIRLKNFCQCASEGGRWRFNGCAPASTQQGPRGWRASSARGAHRTDVLASPDAPVWRAPQTPSHPYAIPVIDL